MFKLLISSQPIPYGIGSMYNTKSPNFNQGPCSNKISSLLVLYSYGSFKSYYYKVFASTDTLIFLFLLHVSSDTLPLQYNDNYHKPCKSSAQHIILQ